MPKVSVSIVTYNSGETIGQALDSLNRQRFRDFEVIVLDNNSRDDTREIVDGFKHRATFPLRTIYLDRNEGFCRGNNIVLKEAYSEYIALLNPDARADEGWLEELVKGMEEDGSAGICTSKILTWDSKGIDSAGDVMLTTLRCFKREAEDRHMYNCREYVFGGCAAGAIYRKKMIDEIGFFDEDFFIQCEDTDLSFRARLAGWKVLYLPDALVFHKVCHSIGRTSDESVYYTQRNMEFVRMKNVPAPVFLLYLPQVAFGLVTDFLYFCVKHGKWRPFLRAKIDAARMLPLMLEKRRRIMGDIRKVHNSEIRSVISPFLLNRHFLFLKLKKFLGRKKGGGLEAG